ncbi:NADH-quinone oxidoreductase subunit NuoH [Acidobacteriota bacterium]
MSLLEFCIFYIVVPLVKVVVVLTAVSLWIAMLILAERKVIGWIQVRMGPIRVGFRGLLQPFADLFKLLAKEDLNPTQVNKFIFFIAPILCFVPAFTAFAVIPWGPESKFWGTVWNWIFGVLGLDIEIGPVPYYISDVNIGILFILAISSLGIFGILLGGWASNSKYPLLGGLRSAAQMISYEVPLGFAVVGALMMAGSLSMVKIIESQQAFGWSFLWIQPLGFFLYYVAMVAETNRLPFDLPEAENELVAGFHTEYSGLKFMFFFFAEYANIVLVSAVATTLFLGGWLPPFHGFISEDSFLYMIPAPLWFVGKICFLLYSFLWVRGTFPRYRYDQLMRLGWKWFIPLAIVNVLCIGLNIIIRKQAGWPEIAMIPLGIAEIVIIAVFVYAWWVIRGKKDESYYKAII